METIHVFTVFKKSAQCKETFDKIWEILVWDLKALLRGEFHTKRHDEAEFSPDEYLQSMRGAYIAGGSRFALIQLKQDWEFLCAVYGFKTWSAHEFCPFCDAEKHPSTWVQGGAQAPWRSTVWDQNKLAQALQGTLILSNGKQSTKMRWA
jgi:hypothetical protein